MKTAYDPRPRVSSEIRAFLDGLRMDGFAVARISKRFHRIRWTVGDRYSFCQDHYFEAKVISKDAIYEIWEATSQDKIEAFLDRRDEDIIKKWIKSKKGNGKYTSQQLIQLLYEDNTVFRKELTKAHKKAENQLGDRAAQGTTKG